MAALIPKGLHQRKRERAVVVLGVDLSDAREEAFACMVCDGLPLAVAFKRAGFTSRDQSAAHRLFHTSRVQERAGAIFEARKAQAALGLPEVTSMLKRVFAGALHDAEYSAAHNAAFSLARIYGHVTDRSTIEVIRRPSRDPDAPAEQALTSWVDSLPGPVPGLSGPALEDVDFLRVPDAPAELLGKPDINWLHAPSPQGPSPELSNDIKGLDHTGGRPENGAPASRVTGTPDDGAQSNLLGGAQSVLLGLEGTAHPGGEEKGAPLQGVKGTGYPKMEDLF